MAPGSRRVLVGFLNNRTYALLCGKRQKGDHDPLSRATRKRRRGHPRARRRRAHGGACGRHHERARAAEPAVARIITSTDKLFVAALNGPAAGVGLAWALAATSSSHPSAPSSSPPSGGSGSSPRSARAGFSPAGSATTVRSPTTCAAATSAPKTHSSWASSRRSIPTTSSSPPRRNGASAQSGFRRTRSR
jgi:hypothetical protein